jgi:hypothetical protein
MSAAERLLEEPPLWITERFVVEVVGGMRTAECLAPGRNCSIEDYFWPWKVGLELIALLEGFGERLRSSSDSPSSFTVFKRLFELELVIPN